MYSSYGTLQLAVVSRGVARRNDVRRDRIVMLVGTECLISWTLDVHLTFSLEQTFHSYMFVQSDEPRPKAWHEEKCPQRRRINRPNCSRLSLQKMWSRVMYHRENSMCLDFHRALFVVRECKNRQYESFEDIRQVNPQNTHLRSIYPIHMSKHLSRNNH